MKKPLIIMTSLVAVLLLSGGVYTIVDYAKYAHSQQSQFFGSKDTYNQNQSMYFDNIKFSVNQVENIEFSPRVTKNQCDQLTLDTIPTLISLYPSHDSSLVDTLARVAINGYGEKRDIIMAPTKPDYIIGSFTVVDFSGQTYGEKQNAARLAKEYCYDYLKVLDQRKIIVIHYSTTNMNEAPKNIKDYIIVAGGNNDIANNDPQHQNTLLSKQTYDSTFVLNVAKNNDGPLALLVTKNSHQKQISLDLPKLVNTP